MSGQPPTLEQATAELTKVKQELEKERAERNFFQLERDRIFTFWEITKNELAEANATLRNKDREMEELEEKQQKELKVFKQKMKHVLYEHQNSIAQLKADGEAALKLEQEEHRAREQVMKRDRRALKLELKEFELSHEDLLKSMKQDQDRAVSKLRANYERMSRELNAKYEKKMRTLRDDLELRRKNEIHEIEERKNGQINALMRNHEKAFIEIKNYYQDITNSNLALINNLKEQIEDHKKKEERNEKMMAEVTAENKRLSEPLQLAQTQCETLKKELLNYEKDKSSLASCKNRIKVMEDREKNSTWKYEVLTQRFEQIQKERDELYDKFVSAIYDVRQKTGFKNLLLEKKLSSMQQSLEKKELQLNEILSASNLDPSAVAAVSKQMEEVLESKNISIKELQYELARVTKAHNDVIRVYEAKLTEFGIPVDDIGFRPLMTKTGLGPAGLVSATK